LHLIRSWPQTIPPGRSYVCDDIPKLVIDNHHYGALADIPGDVLLLEWDMAVGQEDIRQFAHHALIDPGRVLVAPYKIYADAYGLSSDVWAHRKWDGRGMGTISPDGAMSIRDGDPFCNLFGLGMIYLPQALVQGFAGFATHFGDKEFSMWHYQYVAREVPVAWEVRPVHLNFLTPDLGDK
jgi:hypothetical protein